MLCSIQSTEQKSNTSILTINSCIQIDCYAHANVSHIASPPVTLVPTCLMLHPSFVMLVRMHLMSLPHVMLVPVHLMLHPPHVLVLPMHLMLQKKTTMLVPMHPMLHPPCSAHTHAYSPTHQLVVVTTLIGSGHHIDW